MCLTLKYICIYGYLFRQTSGNAKISDKLLGMLRSHILGKPGILITLYTKQRKLHSIGTQIPVMEEKKYYIFFKNS